MNPSSAKLIHSYGRYPDGHRLYRDIYFLELPRPMELPDDLKLPTPKFLGFSVWDSKGTSNGEVNLISRRLLDAGCVALSVFGEGCKEFHDIFDQEAIADSSENSDDDESVIMTTWHSDDSFDDALWYGLFTAFASANYYDQCGVTLVLSIGAHGYREDLRRALDDVEGFHDRMVEATPN